MKRSPWGPFLLRVKKTDGNAVSRNGIVIVVLLLCSMFAQAERLPEAGIASSHPLATEAGHEILAKGGNAFDAAVAVTSTLAVVEPYMSGIGGGGFWLLHRASDGKQVMLDGREYAPGRAHRDMYLDEKGEVRRKASVNGPLAAGIPGVPAALEHLARHYGNLPLSDSMAPAIRIAREGVLAGKVYRRLAKFRLDALRGSPDAAKIFLDDNDVPAEGVMIKQPELADTLVIIAEQGAKGFYTGPLAQRLVTGVRDAGGIWRLEDLARYRVVEREPVAGEVGGARIVSVAPPSSGGVALLTILQQLAQFTPIDRKHHEQHIVVEAMRRAYRDRAEFLGDSDFVDVPVKRLSSQAHAATLASSIDKQNATPSDTLPKTVVDESAGRDTTHFSIIDREGNRVAATLSINYPFGSGFVPAGTGVVLNDEMDDFSAKPGTPNVYGLVGGQANAIAPYKRPLSSMSPSFIESDRGVAVMGTPGGSRIITMVLHGMLDYLDGGSAQSMVSKRRYHHQYLPDVIEHEKGAFTLDQAVDLQFRGHRLKSRRNFGNMQVVLWERNSNRLDAASDPRGIGAAIVK